MIKHASLFSGTLIAVMSLTSALAHAAETISPGNTLQPACGIPNSLPEPPYDGITYYRQHYTVKTKSSGIGQPLASGGLVFYVNLTDADKYFVPKKRIEIIDKSPLNPDVALEAGQKYRVAGVYTNKDGRRFELLKEPSLAGFILVREDGMLCSDRLARSQYGNSYMLRTGMPQAYQELPVETVVEEASNAPYTTAVSITAKEVNSAVAILETTILANSVQKLRKESAVDLLAGESNIGGLKVRLSRQGNKVRVVSIDEPSDWSKWLQDVMKPNR